MHQNKVHTNLIVSSLLLILILFPFPLFSAVKDFIGVWNSDHQIISKVTISTSNENGLCIYIFGKCGAETCGLDGGDVSCIRPQIFLNKSRDPKTNVVAMVIERVYTFKKYRMEFSVEGEKLRLQDFSLFTDGSNRSNYSSIIFFTK